MRCPFCAHPESKVVDSRPSDEGSSIRRRRECLACHKRFTTYETMESLPLMVIKKDGSRQTFDKTKLLNGMIRACEKRPVAFATLEEIAKKIGVDSLGYLSIDNARKMACGGEGKGFCTACFGGGYPTAVPQDGGKDRFECKISERGNL